MNKELTFDPVNIDREVVARTFAAYLMGPLAFENRRSSEGKLRDGPFQKEGTDAHWQLNNSNDYWLHFEPDGSASLNHRYDSGREICRTMIQLFTLRHSMVDKFKL